MSLRTIGQVGAGVIAGALLVGVPTWALASDAGGNSGPESESSQTMSSAACRQMMSDPATRRQMVSIMAETMSQMRDMKGMKGMKGMGAMRGMKGTMPGMKAKMPKGSMPGMGSMSGNN